MDDLISRQAALTALDRLEYTPGEWTTNGLTMCKDAIKALSSAQRWIPCKTALPKSDMDVLVTDGEDCAVAYWRTDAQAWDDSMHGWCDLYGLDVIAWMPLPEAYKEDKCQ